MADLDVSQLLRVGRDVARTSAVVSVKASAAVRKTAFDIEGDAKGYAPVDTGYLRSSIGTDVTGDGNVVTAVIGPTASYGIYQEFGTYKMAAHPFLSPAFDRRYPPFEAAMLALGGRIL